MHTLSLRSRIALFSTVGTLALALAAFAAASAAGPAVAPAAAPSPLHPAYTLRDAAGEPVLASGGAVSTVATCGECHDTDFIFNHNYHASPALGPTGDEPRGRAWDAAGQPAEWNAITYRYVTAGQAGEAAVETNCYLCHLAAPNDAARREAIAAGQAEWAATATLLSTGVVEKTAAGYAWNADAFDANGQPWAGPLTPQDPTNANCDLCHAAPKAEAAGGAPVAVAGCSLDSVGWQTATTGQVMSPDAIAASGVNLAGKAALTRSWDVHAERGLVCSDCHGAPNNPALGALASPAVAEHQAFDPRTLEPGEFLRQPDHNLAFSQYAPEAVQAGGRCESCHNAEPAHPDLPYLSRHLEALACESCHVPALYAPALQQVDWTVLTASAEPALTCRGTDAAGADGLVAAYAPVLLPRPDAGGDGGQQLAPYNLVSAWYWTTTDASGATRPVTQAELAASWFAADGQYAPEIVAALDADGDGRLAQAELKLDTAARQQVVAARLAAQGLAGVTIAAEVVPFRVSHGIADGDWATADCQTCHGDDSLLTGRVQLAGYLPGGSAPAGLGDSLGSAGSPVAEGAALFYQPSTAAAGPNGQPLYVFGHSRLAWIDWLGALAFVGVLAAVGAHGGLRFAGALRSARAAKKGGATAHAATQPVYMYAVYERFWHWLQTGAILLLIFTGLVIHRPSLFGAFSFRHIVTVHNVLAGVLVVNAALSLFYHLVSGEIRQYLPRPYGFFDQAIVQAKYYLGGIFRGAPHPFEKTPRRKLNPLQQVTYFGILNVLLPLQIITGALMWGAQTWPQAAAAIGGLAVLAPVHSLVAWLFAAFVVAHVYLTTTVGHSPLAGIQAMMSGWEDTPAKETIEHDTPDLGATRGSQPAAAP